MCLLPASGSWSGNRAPGQAPNTQLPKIIAAPSSVFGAAEYVGSTALANTPNNRNTTASRIIATTVARGWANLDIRISLNIGFLSVASLSSKIRLLFTVSSLVTHRVDWMCGFALPLHAFNSRARNLFGLNSRKIRAPGPHAARVTHPGWCF